MLSATAMFYFGYSVPISTYGVGFTNELGSALNTFLAKYAALYLHLGAKPFPNTHVTPREVQRESSLTHFYPSPSLDARCSCKKTTPAQVQHTYAVSLRNNVMVFSVR